MKKVFRLINTLITYTKIFGLGRGTLIFYKIKSRNTERVSLKNIRYPIKLRGNSSDYLAFDQIFTDKEYDIDLPFTPKVIIDAGANIGLAAIFFTNRYPESTIISIEPEESNFNLLKENTHKYPNIIALNHALSDKPNQDLAIVDKGYGNWGFMTEPIIDDVHDTTNLVKTITIQDIITKYNLEVIDLLKIDIEGFEKELFETDSESWLPLTRCLIIELHDRMKEGCSKSFFSAISKHNFSFSQRGENLIFINNKI